MNKDKLLNDLKILINEEESDKALERFINAIKLLKMAFNLVETYYEELNQKCDWCFKYSNGTDKRCIKLLNHTGIHTASTYGPNWWSEDVRAFKRLS